LPVFCARSDGGLVGMLPRPHCAGLLGHARGASDEKKRRGSLDRSGPREGDTHKPIPLFTSSVQRHGCPATIKRTPMVFVILFSFSLGDTVGPWRCRPRQAPSLFVCVCAVEPT
jgi:hypothetical protein